MVRAVLVASLLAVLADDPAPSMRGFMDAPEWLRPHLQAMDLAQQREIGRRREALRGAEENLKNWKGGRVRKYPPRGPFDCTSPEARTEAISTAMFERNLRAKELAAAEAFEAETLPRIDPWNSKGSVAVGMVGVLGETSWNAPIRSCCAKRIPIEVTQVLGPAEMVVEFSRQEWENQADLAAGFTSTELAYRLVLEGLPTGGLADGERVEPEGMAFAITETRDVPGWGTLFVARAFEPRRYLRPPSP